MIQPFKPLPIVNENAVVDRFGRSLNVGDYITYASSDSLVHGKIIGYNWLYLQVGFVEQRTANGQLLPACAYPNPYGPGVHPSMLLNINNLISQAQRDIEDPLYAPILDFTPSENKKVARKYGVWMVADKDQPDTSPFTDYQIIVSSIPGSTASEINQFLNHLDKEYGKRVVGELASQRGRNHRGGWHYQNHTRNEGKHNWTMYTEMYAHQTTPQLRSWQLTQSETQLSKRRIQEIGLMNHLDTIMSVTDYNNLDIEEVSKVELML